MFFLIDYLRFINIIYLENVLSKSFLFICLLLYLGLFFLCLASHFPVHMIRNITYNQYPFFQVFCEGRMNVLLSIFHFLSFCTSLVIFAAFINHLEVPIFSHDKFPFTTADKPKSMNRFLNRRLLLTLSIRYFTFFETGDH